MEISLALQTVVFLKAVLLGAALGLSYDVLRALRRTLRAGVGATALCDSLFWLLAVCALFVFVLTAAQGEGRGYILLGGAFGGSLYFLTCSPPVLAVLSAVVGCVKQFVETILDLAKKAGAKMEKLKNMDKAHKKIKEISKKYFHFEMK